jgi:membrane protease YdiL (CAAX protease family)
MHLPEDIIRILCPAVQDKNKYLLSSFLYGALHGRRLAGTVAGMFYAWAMYRRGRVEDAIMAHAATNALIAAEVLLFRSWNLWN